MFGYDWSQLLFLALFGISFFFWNPVFAVSPVAGEEHKTKIQIEFLNDYEMPKSSLNGSRIGGLSGLHCEDNLIYAVSDDRGQEGPPRFYSFEFIFNGAKKSFEIKPKKVFEISGELKPKILDLEAITRKSDGIGSFYLSSEGDLNKKPRILPSFLQLDGLGKIQSLHFPPDLFLPPLTGQQKKGIQNNSAFEAFRYSKWSDSFWAMNENSILQDYNEEKVSTGESVRLIELDGNDFHQKASFSYSIAAWDKSDYGYELHRGVTEIVVLSKNRFIVLERGVALQLPHKKYTGSLYEVELSGDRVLKNEIFNFQRELLPQLKFLKLENFEGLCLGPRIDGQQTLLMVSDDNFSKAEKTLWVLFKLK